MLRMPWPPKELSPNSRKQHRYTTEQRANFKAAWWAVFQESRHIKTTNHLRLTFCPPCARRRDMDNMLASIKSGLDGLSTAVMTDDSNWDFTLIRGPKEAHGAVYVEFIDPPKTDVLIEGVIG